MGPILKFMRLRWCDRTALLKTYLLLTSIRLGLWLLPFQGLRKLLDCISRPSHPAGQPLESWPNLPQPNPQQMHRRMQMIHLCCRYLPGHVKCLARALTAQVILRRHHHPCQLRIGVAKNPRGQLDAHAWVELKGEVVMGQVDDLGRYTMMSALQ